MPFDKRAVWLTLSEVFARAEDEKECNSPFAKIRSYGAGSFQIARRLRAMGENLVQTLPAYRHAALRTELELLDREIGARFVFPEDAVLARLADAQGMGGARHRS